VTKLMKYQIEILSGTAMSAVAIKLFPVINGIACSVAGDDNSVIIIGNCTA
jgi:hypothetical protein